MLLASSNCANVNEQLMNCNTGMNPSGSSAAVIVGTADKSNSPSNVAAASDIVVKRNDRATKQRYVERGAVSHPKHER